MTTLERLRAIIVDVLNVDADLVVPSANFINDLGADSLDHIELLMAVESELDLELDDEALEKVQTVQDAASLIDAATLTQRATA
ncbi:acyl carrier protein [Neorhizobium sp. DAR64872/K0K18]|uniref:acyl carrier protein n=1 Tax=Neorhizobium sp. DAR64872/K0K18 TaxID=3421958 RepID=UPI003D2A996E